MGYLYTYLSRTLLSKRFRSSYRVDSGCLYSDVQTNQASTDHIRKSSYPAFI